MKIEVNLNNVSIKNAIKVLKQQKKWLKSVMMKELMISCVQRIIQFANENLAFTDIGENVKKSIASSWSYKALDRSYNTIIIRNSAEKAVYVEFGVGIVGEKYPHDKAKEVGYNYNTDTGSKSNDGSWTFFTNENDLDLPVDALIAHNWYNDYRGVNGSGGRRLLVTTKGAPATMFLFNAILRFINEDVARKEWEKIKAKYWG